MLLPPIHAHSRVEGLNCQKSLNSLSTPFPPKSQKLPFRSVQLVAAYRPPGMFPAAAEPKVPYTPAWQTSLLQDMVLLPPIQAHSREEGLNSQRSLRL